MAAQVIPGGVIEGGGGAAGSPLAPNQASGRRLVSYDPTNLFILYGALPIHRGIAAGTFLTAERNVDTWKFHKGTDGERCRVRSNNQSATISLTLRQGTWVNDALSSIALGDELTGLFAVPLIIKDSNGRSLYAALYSWPQRPADVVYGSNEGTVVWNFEVDPWIPFTGGFSPVDPRDPSTFPEQT